ncbi:MAG: pseudouridine synthase [Polyangiaceae bacterium]
MRVECPHAGQCTGCPLIELEYDEQLGWKQRRVEEALSVYPALRELRVAPTAAADPVTGYRVRAKLVVGSGGRVGLFAREGHAVVDLPGCRVLTPPVARAVEVLRELLRAPPNESGSALVSTADGGALAAVDVREALADGAPKLFVTWIGHAARTRDAELAAFARALEEHAPEVAGVAVSDQRHPARVLGAEPRRVAGERELMDRVGESVQRAVPGAFVQAHRGQAVKLHQAIVLSLASEFGGLRGRVVWDLYGGSGAIGLALQAAGARVTLVESHGAAVAAARRAGLDALVADAALRVDAPAPAAVVVNPPRRGLAPDVRRRVARANPELVVYVSCSPETLARDLDHFGRLGFGSRDVAPFDMIPLSEHVEALVVLRKVPAPQPTLLFENDELLVLDKPPHEPTAPRGEHEGSLLERVRRMPGAEQAVPLHRLGFDTSGACVFAKHPDFAGAWAQSWARGETRERYLALVRGIARKKGAVNRPLVESGQSRPARTRYERLEVVNGHSLLGVEVQEGGKDQIRRHLAGIGHPILGDERYGHAATNRHHTERYGLDRQLLHLAELAFASPGGGPRIQVTSPLPGDFISILKRMGAKRTHDFGGR